MPSARWQWQRNPYQYNAGGERLHRLLLEYYSWYTIRALVGMGVMKRKNVFVIFLIFVLSKSLIDCLVMMTLFFHIVWWKLNTRYPSGKYSHKSKCLIIGLLQFVPFNPGQGHFDSMCFLFSNYNEWDAQNLSPCQPNICFVYNVTASNRHFVSWNQMEKSCLIVH